MCALRARLEPFMSAYRAPSPGSGSSPPSTPMASGNSARPAVNARSMSVRARMRAPSRMARSVIGMVGATLLTSTGLRIVRRNRSLTTAIASIAARAASTFAGRVDPTKIRVISEACYNGWTDRHAFARYALRASACRCRDELTSY